MKTTVPTTTPHRRSRGNFLLFLHRGRSRSSAEPSEKTSRTTEIVCLAAFILVLVAIGLLLSTHAAAAR